MNQTENKTIIHIKKDREGKSKTTLAHAQDTTHRGRHPVTQIGGLHSTAEGTLMIGGAGYRLAPYSFSPYAAAFFWAG